MELDVTPNSVVDLNATLLDSSEVDVPAAEPVQSPDANDAPYAVPSPALSNRAQRVRFQVYVLGLCC